MKLNPQDNTYSVSSLNADVAQLLEQTFAWIWVEGEISNLAQPHSGHLYFNLKDARAQIRCAMFRGRNRSLTFTPDNGQQVLVRAKISLYQARGDYQLIVDKMQAAGDGLLQQQFEALKLKLSHEGLFDATHKQEIPEFVQNICLITSKTGAVVHDVISVIERRFPALNLKLFAVPVQGEQAAPAINHAIKLINQQVQTKQLNCDLILLARGGGSLEDLQCFNEESMARTIFNSKIPIVSGIGHEVDITIADLVADLRGATPSVAAESITPEMNAWLQTFDHYSVKLEQLLKRKTHYLNEKRQWLHRRLMVQHPANQLQQSKQQYQHLSATLLSLQSNLLAQKKQQLNKNLMRLWAQNPQQSLSQNKQILGFLSAKLKLACTNNLAQKKRYFSNISRTLNAISPLNTLARGYSLTQDNQGNALRSTQKLKNNDIIITKLYDGEVVSLVTTLNHKN